MLKSPDESEYSQKPPENSERKPQREIFKEFARTQLDSIGYSLLVKQLSDFFKGNGAVSELEQLVPHLFGNNNDYLSSMINMMKRVPNSDEARKLLATAIFGEPAKRNEDGTIVVTSFTVAEPSSATIQSKVSALGDNQDDESFVPNTTGTDKLVRKLISDSGFLKEDETVETIFQLKKGNKISLPHPSIISLNTNIEGPVDSGKSDTKTAYSYNVKTTLSPST